MKNKKITIISIIILLSIILTACNSIDNNNENNDGSRSSSSIYKDTTSSKTNSKDSSISHYCEKSGCTREGIKEYIGISGKTEYYCVTHFNEIMDTLGKMESDVGAGSYSKHTCEECNK